MPMPRPHPNTTLAIHQCSIFSHTFCLTRLNAPHSHIITNSLMWTKCSSIISLFTIKTYSLKLGSRFPDQTLTSLHSSRVALEDSPLTTTLPSTQQSHSTRTTITTQGRSMTTSIIPMTLRTTARTSSSLVSQSARPCSMEGWLRERTWITHCLSAVSSLLDPTQAQTQALRLSSCIKRTSLILAREEEMLPFGWALVSFSSQR